MFARFLRVNPLYAAVSVVVLAIGTFLSALLYFASQVDSVNVAEQQALVANALNVRVGEVAADAIELDRTGVASSGIVFAARLGGDGQTQEIGDADQTLAGSMLQRAAPLADSVRSINEALPGQAAVVSAIVTVNSQAFVLTAATSGWGSSSRNGTITIVAHDLEQSVRAVLADRLLLNDSQVALGDATPPGLTSIALTNENGDAVGALEWRPRKPGAAIVQQVAIPAILMIAALGFVGFLFYRHARKLTMDRQQSEVQRQSAEQASHAKSQFIANMSHELRTPLNAIIGYSEMVREDLDAGSEAVADIDRVLSAANHLLRLINDILDVSKIESGRMSILVETIDPIAITREVADTLAPAAAATGAKIRLEFSSEAPASFNTDGMKLRQCLLNLVSNAVKFTRDGEVHLHLSADQIDGEDALRISVRDTGIGISDEQLARLFQPFTQADETFTRKYGGTGLGLVLTRAMARALGGDVTVSSELGRGSEFVLTIKACAAEAQLSSAGEFARLVSDENVSPERIRAA